MYQSKVDNFMIVFDASSSMGDLGKFEIAQALVLRMNETIPEMGQTAGLRSCGHAPKVTEEPTKLFYGMEKYLSHNLENSFEKITMPGGTSQIYRVLDETKADLGRT